MINGQFMHASGQSDGRADRRAVSLAAPPAAPARARLSWATAAHYTPGVSRVSTPVRGMDRNAANTLIDRYVDERLPAWIEELREFCAIPSEENEPAAVRAAADWTRDRLERLGAAVDVLGFDAVPPLVVGSVGSGPTLVAVQHYDVQPAVPLELWTTPPYEPTVRDGRLFARGVTDNKGEFLARVWGVEAYLATVGELPCRIRFAVEGEEEHGSPNLGRLLDLAPDLRAADGALEEGGSVDPEGRPEIVGGIRGMTLVELTARTLAYDAHSSLAMLLPNAAT